MKKANIKISLASALVVGLLTSTLSTNAVADQFATSTLECDYFPDESN